MTEERDPAEWMINQPLSLLCDESHCLKARNYIMGILKYLKVTANLGRPSGLVLLGCQAMTLLLDWE